MLAVTACVCVCVQVNQENVVKVGHRQVVNMIRQGGNRLVIKVVTVTRNLDNDDNARKKGTAPTGQTHIHTQTTHMYTHTEVFIASLVNEKNNISTVLCKSLRHPIFFVQTLL